MHGCVCDVPCLILLEISIGNLSSAVIYFTLESETNEDPPEFTLTCQSRNGPVTEVEWRRDGVRVEEDSNHMTSQVIVDTSRNTIYNNTLRVRGREGGRYNCTVRNNAQDFFPDSDIQRDQTTGTLLLRGKSLTSTTSLHLTQKHRLLLTSLLPTSRHQVSCWSGHLLSHLVLVPAMWSTISLEESVTINYSVTVAALKLYINSIISHLEEYTASL